MNGWQDKWINVQEPEVDMLRNQKDDDLERYRNISKYNYIHKSDFIIYTYRTIKFREI